MRWLLPSLLMFSVSAASAHFTYIVPESATKGRIVFSDSLKADEKVPIDKVADLKLQVVQDGKASELTKTIDKKANVYRIDVPGEQTRVVVGTISYGVIQRGDAKPFLLKYHPKAVFGTWANGSSVNAGKAAPFEISPVQDGVKIRFLVLLEGKPVPKAEVSVLVPGDEKAKTITTDDTGHTEFFDKPGQYAVQTKQAQTTTGDVDGKKYDEVRHYATLVVTHGK